MSQYFDLDRSRGQIISVTLIDPADEKQKKKRKVVSVVTPKKEQDKQKKRKKKNSSITKIPDMVILHQLAPFMHFHKLRGLACVNKQFHHTLGFLFNSRAYWFPNPDRIKAYFSRITWMRPVKCMYWDIISLIENFSNIKTIDLSKYWPTSTIMYCETFTGTLVIPMNHGKKQVKRQLNAFPSISELVLRGGKLFITTNALLCEILRIQNSQNEICKKHLQ